MERQGLRLRGAFHPTAEDLVPPLAPGIRAQTLVLLGFVGNAGWAKFSASAEAADGLPDPLDRWSRHVIDILATHFGALALYPFGLPPWLPFSSWAKRAEPVSPSLLGLLIHPHWGLWHSYRGALAFAEWLDLPPVKWLPSPCQSCAAKPCLSACPVGAFSPGGYDVATCLTHLAEPAGQDCMTLGCRARQACPVGAPYRQKPEQAGFHMRAFCAGAIKRGPISGRDSWSGEIS